MIRISLAATLLATTAPALAETHTISPGEGAQERLQEALILAQPGDEIVLEEESDRFVDWSWGETFSSSRQTRRRGPR